MKRDPDKKYGSVAKHLTAVPINSDATFDHRVWRMLYSDEAKELQRDMAKAVDKYLAYCHRECGMNASVSLNPPQKVIHTGPVTHATLDWPQDN